MANNNRNNSVKTAEKLSAKVQKVMNANVKNLANSDAAPRSIPFYPTQLLTFDLDKLQVIYHPQQDNIKEWSGITAVDGTEVSVNQLIRRGNGLNVSRSTVKESVAAFLTLIDENGGVLQVRIKEVRTRELIQSDGTHSQQNILIFELA